MDDIAQDTEEVDDIAQDTEEMTTLHELTDQQLDDLRETFELFDKNKDNKIDSKELGNLLRSLGQNPTDNEVQEMIEEVDLNRNGTIEFDECVQMMRIHIKLNDPAEELKRAFEVFDKDGNGYISAGEFREVMTTLGEKLKDDEVDEILQKSDVDGDGQLNYQEFVDMFTGSPAKQ